MTGLRRGELLGLQWTDLDLDTGSGSCARQILVRGRSVSDAPRVYVRETTKSSNRRVVRFDPATGWRSGDGRRTPRSASRRGGWSITTTAVYSHDSDDVGAEAAGRHGGLLDGTVHGVGVDRE